MPEEIRRIKQGTRVLSSPDFDREDLELEITPYVRVEGNEFAFEGTFHIGLFRAEFAFENLYV